MTNQPTLSTDRLADHRDQLPGQEPPLLILLTARQAAAALSISERTLWELTHRGELPPIRLPGRGKARSIRYAVADLQAWIDRQRAATVTTQK